MADLVIESRQEEQSKISANWIKRMREYMASSDQVIILDDAMRQADITHSDVFNGRNIQQKQLSELVRIVQKQVPDISLQMFAKAELSDLGVMGYAAISSDTVGRALEFLSRYHELTSDRYIDTISIENDVAIISPVPSPGHMQDFRSIAEDSLAGNWRTLHLLLGTQVNFVKAEARFDYPPPDYVDTYREAFECSLKFNCDRNELRFPQEWLALPLETANQTMADVCAAMCERLLGARDASRATPQVVRRLLLSRPGRNMYRLEEAAEVLNLSTAQLRKRLYRAGTSYKKIVLEIRMVLAEHYLLDTVLNIQEIAYLLDYSQPAPFSRAFKRYFGVSPVTHRARSALTA
jgi:AraC-like DNA-binding protein